MGLSILLSLLFSLTAYQEGRLWPEDAHLNEESMEEYEEKYKEFLPPMDTSYLEDMATGKVSNIFAYQGRWPFFTKRVSKG